MPKKIAVLLDGGHVRVYAKDAGMPFTPDYIEKVGLACSAAGEEIFRVLYYDCAPYAGTVTLPVSGAKKSFHGSDQWMRELAQKNLFAVRRGALKFRGFALDKNKIPYKPTAPLQDSDFVPQFEQKGVDMRIGLDMAIFAATRAVDLIALVTNDTDCVPAMKHARRSGLQVALIAIPGYTPTSELIEHSDFRRPITWPAP
jgi:uncharacterized LabA/DUF88 family protein